MDALNMLMLMTIAWITILPGPGFVVCQTKEQVNLLLTDLTTNYNKLIRPVTNQSQAITVILKTLPQSIYEFDEVFGSLNMMSSIFLIWEDESLRWNKSDYGGVSSVNLPYSDVWVPNPILSNPTENSAAVGSTNKDWLKVSYRHTGQALLVSSMVTKTTCTANVQKYPFDVQTCDIIYSLANYLPNEVMLISYQTKIDKTVYEQNALWDLIDSDVSSFINGAVYAVKTTLKLKRRPMYVVLNIIMPIFCLSLLKNLVFLLPADAGERVSYSITVLLSISVFMTIVNGSLPTSSNPVSIFSIYLVSELLLNMLTTAIVVMNLRFHHRQPDGNVPTKLKQLLAKFSFKISNGRHTKIQPINVVQKQELGQEQMTVVDIDNEDISKTKSNHNSTVVDIEADDNVDNWTWKTLAIRLDTVCFPLFCTLSIFFFLLFIFITQMI